MDQYGSDYLTISDENGVEYELEILNTLEYNGSVYLAVIPAAEDPEAEQWDVSILKSVEEAGGESVLLAIDDPQELQDVYERMMESLYEESGE